MVVMRCKRMEFIKSAMTSKWNFLSIMVSLKSEYLSKISVPTYYAHKIKLKKLLYI